MTSPADPPSAPAAAEPDGRTAAGDPPAASPAAAGAGLVLPDGSAATPTGSDDQPGGVLGATEQILAAPLSVIARVPVRRITRVQAAALVVFSLVLLGPVVAWVVVWRSDPTVPVVVQDPDITVEDGLNLSMTVTSVNTTTRELGVRMTVKSTSTGPNGLIVGGRMTETVNLGLPAAPGSLQGDTTVTLEKGATVGPIEFTTQLTDGSIARYPYDTYLSQILIIASRDGDGDSKLASSIDEGSNGTSGSTTSGGGSGSTSSDTRIPVPISTEVMADVPGFVIGGEIPPGQAASTRTIDLDVRRNGPTLVYTTWIMLLWWALSVSAVFLVWSVAIWRSSPPPWAYGYLVGVLFALAPLRSSLPGQPPSGVLIDYVSFYWAVGTVGLALLILLSFFLRDTRNEGRSRTRQEELLADRAADAAYDTGEVQVVPARPTPPATPAAPLGVPLGAEPTLHPDDGRRRD